MATNSRNARQQQRPQSRPQNSSTPSPGGVMQTQAETKENPMDPAQTPPVIESKENPETTLDSNDQLMESKSTSAPSGDENDGQEPGQSNDDADSHGLSGTETDENQNYYYNAVGDRVIRRGGQLQLRLEEVNGAMVVQERTLQEISLPNTDRIGFILLYPKGAELPKSMLQAV